MHIEISVRVPNPHIAFESKTKMRIWTISTCPLIHPCLWASFPFPREIYPSYLIHYSVANLFASMYCNLHNEDLTAKIHISK